MFSRVASTPAPSKSWSTAVSSSNSRQSRACERTDPTLPVSQQCRLLAVSRSSVYRRPAEVGEEDRTIMALIDRHYLARPYYGSRRMAAWLATQGHLVNRKRVQPLMRLMGLVAIYQRPNTKYGKAARRPSCRRPPLTALLGSG